MKHLRKTKIICTIGPASDTEEMMEKLIHAGMNIARINCSHGDIEQRQDIVDKLKKVRDRLSVPLAIMLDTRGPEFRLKTFKKGKVNLKDGAKFTLTTEDVKGDSRKVSVSYKGLCDDLDTGDTVLVNDGLVKLKVVKVNKPNIVCTVVDGGELSNNKSLNFPGKDLSLEYLSDSDKEDMLFCIKNKIEYIACSFVSCGEDIKSVRDFLDENGGKNVDLISKIENQSGINNLDDICKYSTGVMVARGDLGVEIDFDKLPAVQKRIIRACRKKGLCAITSTEMLESMIHNPRPTRAEISDVANAVYDSSSVLMLSGETAAGKYPVESVETMAKIIKSTEKIVYKNTDFEHADVVSSITAEAIAHATCVMNKDVLGKAIVNFTNSGLTSKLISNFRPNVDVISFVFNINIYHKLAMFWGICPKIFDCDITEERIVDYANKICKEVLRIKPGEKFVICAGWDVDGAGYTNFLKVMET